MHSETIMIDEIDRWDGFMSTLGLSFDTASPGVIGSLTILDPAPAPAPAPVPAPVSTLEQLVEIADANVEYVCTHRIASLPWLNKASVTTVNIVATAVTIIIALVEFVP